MATFTSTNYTDISYIAEVTAGTTPASPAFQTLPTKGTALMGNTTTAVSAVIRRDRQIDDLVIVDQDVSGNLDFELSFAPYKPLLTSLLQGTPFVLAIAAAINISFTAPSTIASVTSVFTGLLPGMYILVSGAAAANNNGLFKVVTATGTSITVAETTITTAAAGATIKLSANSIRNGVQTPTSYTFAKQITGITTPAFMYYRGCQISSMDLAFDTGAILGGSIGVIGLTETVTETAIGGQTFVASPAYTIMNSVSALALESTGLSAGTAFQSIKLKVDNGINAAKAIGTLGAANLASFTLNVTADMSIYFQDIVAYNKYLQATSFNVVMKATDGAGNKIVVSMPNCKFEKLEAPIAGKDAFLMLNGSFRALRDPTLNYTIQLDLIAA